MYYLKSEWKKNQEYKQFEDILSSIAFVLGLAVWIAVFFVALSITQ